MFVQWSGVVYNLPPHLRTSYSGMLLYGILPAKIKNYNVYYEAMFARLRSAYTGAEGFVGAGARKWLELVNKVHFVSLSYVSYQLGTVCQ